MFVLWHTTFSAAVLVYTLSARHLPFAFDPRPTVQRLFRPVHTWVSLGVRLLPPFRSRARNHLTDPGPRFGMLANVSSVVSRRSPIVFSPAYFAAFRIRVGKRTISIKVSSGRSGPRSNISQRHFSFEL